MELSWEEFFDRYCQTESGHKLSEQLGKVYESADAGDILPDVGKLFRAFSETPMETTRVVILGQDPYPTPGHATGLAFGVEPQVELPQSLSNIFSEVEAQLGYYPEDRTLLSWARRGILLLNTSLTVRAGMPGSHRGIWQHMTTCVVQELNKLPFLVWLLWGSHAKGMRRHIYNSRHVILTSSHPSGQAAHISFFGNGHFRAAVELTGDKCLFR